MVPLILIILAGIIVLSLLIMLIFACFSKSCDYMCDRFCHLCNSISSYLDNSLYNVLNPLNNEHKNNHIIYNV